MKQIAKKNERYVKHSQILMMYNFIMGYEAVKRQINLEIIRILLILLRKISKKDTWSLMRPLTFKRPLEKLYTEEMEQA